MLAATMDPAEKIEANVETATYTYLRRRLLLDELLVLLPEGLEDLSQR